MIEIKNLSLTIEGKGILKDINLKIADNKTTVITGHNGSGKSTLMKCIAGIEKPSGGQIIFGGKDITNLGISERANLGISYAMQQPVKFKGITVRDLLKLAKGKCQCGKGKADCDKAICDAISGVGLCPKDYLDREVGTSLSGGELKRIEIASVILRNSKLVIFDEPEAGIDIWSFNRLINLFNDLNKKLGCAVIIVSHQEKIINIADDIVLINNGTVEGCGTKDKMLPLLYSEKQVKKCKRQLIG